MTRRPRASRFRRLAAWLAASSLAGAVSAQGESFYNFESGHVRPLALFNDLLYAVNTPDNRLSIFRVSAAGLTRVAEVPVGLEPVAVAARCNPCFDIIDGPRRTDEVWVINHLSDGASIVEVDPSRPEAAFVRRTIHLCDEPRDIVFAGQSDRFAFISAARRGQNCRPNPVAGGVKNTPVFDLQPFFPAFREPGAPRALVQVFDTLNLGVDLGGTPVRQILLPGDTPRALARGPGGEVVYAAVFHSGSRTTTIDIGDVAANGGLPTPPPQLAGQLTGLIARQSTDGGPWSVLGDNRTWPVSSVSFSLPDNDVFVIDAMQFPYPILRKIAGVGTVLFNIAVRRGKFFECPQVAIMGGKCPTAYVSNTDARNHVRFEDVLEHHITDTRITKVDSSSARPVAINPHIDYSQAGTASEREKSLALPMGITLSPDESWLYVAGFGSGKIGIFATTDLDAGNGTARALLSVGAGPSGFAVDASCQRLYVMNRFDQAISVVENPCVPGTAAQNDALTVNLAGSAFDPSPPAVTKGRRFLYDAVETSEHGDAACASCHVFGDLDSLAWDLGNDSGEVTNNPNTFRVEIGTTHGFRSMKGPMATQSLRGLTGAGPMHWRGDKTGALAETRPNCVLPVGTESDAGDAFLRFNPAFETLLGRATCLPAPDMRDFRDFTLTLRYPPNPVRRLDNQLRSGFGISLPSESVGEDLFLNHETTTDPRNLGGAKLTCVFCHRLDPAQQDFGTDGLSSFEGLNIQEMKIPHLRNLYQKVGMFGGPSGTGSSGPYGDQVRGFGFLHDGSIATLFDFLNFSQAFDLRDSDQRDLEAFLLAFDTGLKPAVGQQLTVSAATSADGAIQERIDLLFARHEAGDCELVAKGYVRATGETRGYLYKKRQRTFKSQGGTVVVGPEEHFFLTDQADSQVSYEALMRSKFQPVSLTLTCVPPGSGWRIGIDRDEDGICDGDDSVLAKPSTPLAAPPSACVKP